MAEKKEHPPAIVSVQNEIKRIDAALVHLLTMRFYACTKMAVVKSELKLAISEANFNDEQLALVRRHAVHAGGEASLIDMAFREIIRLSNLQEKSIWWAHIAHPKK